GGAGDVAVAADAAEAAIDGEGTRFAALVHEPRAEARVVAPRVEAAPEGADLAEGLLADGRAPHVDAGPEGARPVGAGAHATLDLDVLQPAGQIRHVDPEHALALGIVDGHAVEGD